MTDLIGWAITTYADHGEWLLAAPLAVTAGWASHRLTTRAIRRAQARQAEAAARPTTDELEALYTRHAIKPRHRNTNTRKENRP